MIFFFFFRLTSHGFVHVGRSFCSLEPLRWAEYIFEHALTIVLYEKVTLKDTFPSEPVVKVGFGY